MKLGKQASSLNVMLVANSQIAPGTNRRELKSVLGFAIRHQHQCEDEPVAHDLDGESLDA
jgi:hypothetical protein